MMCVRFCFEDDAYFVTSAWPGANCRPFRDATINSLKHKLLVYLYKRAKYISYVTKDPYELRRFYQYFDQVLFKNASLSFVNFYAIYILYFHSLIIVKVD